MQKAVALGVEVRVVGPKARAKLADHEAFADSRRQHLSFTAREEIALLNAQGEGVREIALRLGRFETDSYVRFLRLWVAAGLFTYSLIRPPV
ncbi:helix-turn-helix domain-containing protein [Streptomyces sp. 021-4]|uniref:helix-turn-helix domain-containing protein n=1 Tax=Streptomyces sp. 021-4 TaxID=2789260 RepID=UPI0039F51D6E